MSEHHTSDWDRILSQRLERETKKIAPPKAKDAPAGGTFLFDPSSIEVPRKQQEGRIDPRSPTAAVPPPPSAPSPAPALDTWLSMQSPVAPTPSSSAPPAPAPSIAAAPAAAAPSAPAQDAKRLTVGWPVAQPLETIAHWSTPNARGSDPALVVDQLRKLSPQEERKAFEILRGKRPRGASLKVLAASVAAAAVAAGAVLAFQLLSGGQRELQLVADLAPPEEADAIAPGAIEPVEEAAASPGPTSPEKPVPEAQPAEPPRTSNDQASAPSGEPLLEANEGPTFALTTSRRAERWVPIRGPSIDLRRAPPAVSPETLSGAARGGDAP
jgi:hypothetical protein